MDDNRVTLSLEEYEKLVRVNRIVKEGPGGEPKLFNSGSRFANWVNILTLAEAEAKLQEVFGKKVKITPPESEDGQIKIERIKALEKELAIATERLKDLTSKHRIATWDLNDKTDKLEQRAREVQNLLDLIDRLESRSFWDRVFGR